MVIHACSVNLKGTFHGPLSQVQTVLVLFWHFCASTLKYTFQTCDLENDYFIAKSNAQTNQPLRDYVEFKQVVYTISVVSSVEKFT